MSLLLEIPRGLTKNKNTAPKFRSDCHSSFKTKTKNLREVFIINHWQDLLMRSLCRQYILGCKPLFFTFCWISCKYPTFVLRIVDSIQAVLCWYLLIWHQSDSIITSVKSLLGGAPRLARYLCHPLPVANPPHKNFCILLFFSMFSVFIYSCGSVTCIVSVCACVHNAVTQSWDPLPHECHLCSGTCTCTDSANSIYISIISKQDTKETTSFHAFSFSWVNFGTKIEFGNISYGLSSMVWALVDQTVYAISFFLAPILTF